MIAVDSNLLIYAHREDSLWHEQAADKLRELGRSSMPWAIPWPCVHEFLAIVTHPRVFPTPTPLPIALDTVSGWLDAPHLFTIGESTGYARHLRRVVVAGRIVGPRVHDAKIAAICLHHGIDELWTADRDFSRFPKLKTRNPLVS